MGLIPTSALSVICSASIPIFANLETSEKVYSGNQHMCPQDGWVAFHNSHLIR